ncbi:MAG TPA: TauD/TfdA family dioxygenase [Allosphingosinicella sp.]
MQIDPLPQWSFGARVTGISLTDATHSEATRLLTLLWRFKFLLFRKQFLSEEQQVRAVEGLGALELHRPRGIVSAARPEIFRVAWGNIAEHATVDSYWHLDGCTRDPPTRIATYRVPVLPNSGGDTLFVDGGDVLESLPKPLKSFVSNSYWTHISGREQPFVRRHPDTGRKSLVVNLGKMVAARGLAPWELDGFIADLSFYIDGAGVRRHVWQEGDFLITDNLALLHRAEPPVGGETRILHRVSVLNPVRNSDTRSVERRGLT